MTSQKLNNNREPQAAQNEFLEELVLPESPKRTILAEEALNTIGVVLADEEPRVRQRIFAALSKYVEELSEVGSFLDNATHALKSGGVSRDMLEAIDRHFAEVPARLKEMWREVNHGVGKPPRELQDQIVWAMNDPIRDALGDAQEFIELFQAVDAALPQRDSASLTTDEKADIVRSLINRIAKAYSDEGFEAAYRAAVHPDNLRDTGFQLKGKNLRMFSETDPLLVRDKLVEYVGLDLTTGCVAIPRITFYPHTGPLTIEEQTKKDILLLLTEQYVRIQSLFRSISISRDEIVGEIKKAGMGELLDDYHRARLTFSRR